MIFISFWYYLLRSHMQAHWSNEETEADQILSGGSTWDVNVSDENVWYIFPLPTRSWNTSESVSPRALYAVRVGGNYISHPKPIPQAPLGLRCAASRFWETKAADTSLRRNCVSYRSSCSLLSKTDGWFTVIWRSGTSVTVTSSLGKANGRAWLRAWRLQHHKKPKRRTRSPTVLPDITARNPQACEMGFFFARHLRMHPRP